MNDSRFSFATPTLKLDTDQSNPQNDECQGKQTKNEMSFGKNIFKNELSFKKLMKNNIFAEDLNYSHESGQQICEQQKFARIKKNTSSGRKPSASLKISDQRYSPKMTNLLQNCKASILSLQQELNRKNLVIQKIEKEKEFLSIKLTSAQKQIQRTHLIISIYMKQSHEKTVPKPIQTQIVEPQSTVQIRKISTNKSLKTQFQELRKINEQYVQENQKLKNQNSWLQTEVSQLNSQNWILNQKIQTMGKGVGKALSTIKKNNESSRKITEFILLSERKDFKRSREDGKISTQKSNKKITEQSFETPTKVTISNTQESTIPNSSKSFYETSKQKLTDISIKAKRLDQFQKLQQILTNMQILAQNDSESQNSCH